MIVQSQSAKKAILTALADEEMMKILDSVMYHSKSIVDISREYNIPHTTCYRKTKWLLNEGLVIVDRIIITPEGKKFSLYHSVLKSINVKYESNNVIIEAKQNFDIIKKTMSRFYWRDMQFHSTGRLKSDGSVQRFYRVLGRSHK